MAEIHDKILKIMEENGIPYEDNRQLAQDIMNLARDTNAQHLRSILFSEKNFTEGSHCPVCSRKVRLNRKALDAKMCYFLIRLYHLSHADTTKFFHVERDIQVSMGVGGSWAKLRYWGLIEAQPKEKHVKQSNISGMWRITVRGVGYVQMEGAVEKYINLYNRQFYNYAGRKINIKEALGDTYKYDELMNR